jgi:hypothetical protein
MSASGDDTKRQRLKKQKKRVEDPKLWFERTWGKEENQEEQVRKLMVEKDTSTHYKMCQFAMDGEEGRCDCLFLLCSECEEPFYEEHGPRALEVTKKYGDCKHAQPELKIASEHPEYFKKEYIYEREGDGVVASRCICCNGRVCINY